MLMLMWRSDTICEEGPEFELSTGSETALSIIVRAGYSVQKCVGKPIYITL